jgi:hypothetical protein
MAQHLQKYPSTHRKEYKMKTKYLYILPVVALGVASIGTLASAGGVGIYVAPPTVVISAPPPPVVVAPAPVVVVPDNYVWDGYEYVGYVGNDCYYLGPGNVWIVMDAPRLERFHSWERVHTDWRSHEIRNVNYRGAYHSQPAPAHDSRPYTQPAHEDQPQHDNRVSPDRGHETPNNHTDEHRSGPPQ